MQLNSVFKHHQGWSGTAETELKSGSHKVVVELECAYIDANKLTGLNAFDLHVQKWPTARKRWRRTLLAPLVISPPDDK